jgi:hypothetical protein
MHPGGSRASLPESRFSFHGDARTTLPRFCPFVVPTLTALQGVPWLDLGARFGSPPPMATCVACGGSGVCSGCCGHGVLRGLTCPSCRGEKHCPASGCEAARARRKVTTPEFRLQLDEDTGDPLGVEIDD